MNSGTAVHHFQFESCQLAYRIRGNGPMALLAFHGFGQDSRVFDNLPLPAQSPYTLYAIDLFFHGESQLPDGQLLTKTDWNRLIGAFLAANSIDRFSLLGFSLGGRFALITAEHYSQQLEQLILMAPDGITPVFWYKLATNTAGGRSVFSLALRHLSALSLIGHTLTRLGLLHRTVMRFAEVSLATPEQRRLVYQSWTFFRAMTVDLPVLAALLNQSPVRVRFFTGHFDRIVPVDHIDPLANRLHRYELTVLKTGHNRLIEQVGRLL